jgi:hypothetical protein
MAQEDGTLTLQCIRSLETGSHVIVEDSSREAWPMQGLCNGQVCLEAISTK